RPDSESRFNRLKSVGFRAGCLGERIATDTQRSRRQIFGALAAVVLVAVAVGTWWLSRRGTDHEALSPMSITPFTSFPGEIMAPRFSPDGSQVAFLWDRGEAKKPEVVPPRGVEGVDVYLKLIGETTPLRLTKAPT